MAFVGDIRKAALEAKLRGDVPPVPEPVVEEPVVEEPRDIDIPE